MEDEEQIKEVYARFGLAMFQAQCVERQLAILLATEYGPGTRNITADQYDVLLNSLFGRTFGSLISHFRTTGQIPASIEFPLTEALKKRNWLAHEYFWERAPHFMTAHGRLKMIAELQGCIDMFGSIDKTLSDLSVNWARKQGISRETIDLELKRLLDEANRIQD